MKNGKRILSVLLAVLMLALACPLSGFAAGSCNCGYTPIIYIKGQQTIYKTLPDGTKVAYGSDDDEQVEAATKELLQVFAKTLVTQDWDAYAKRGLELLVPLVECISYDENGNVDPNTGIEWSWTPASVSASHSYHGAYYTYEYDYRLPLQTLVEDLHAYIETVKAKTGHDKIIIASRCGGTNLAEEYLYKYEIPTGYADLEKVLFVCGNLLGSDFVEAIFSGNVKINSEAAYRFLKSYNHIDIAEMIGEPLADYLYAALDMLEQTYGTDMLYIVVNDLYNKLKDNFFAPFLKAYHGINPGTVTFINEHYEEYKDYVFQEEGDKEKYADRIAELDDYHYNVQVKTEEILQDAKAHGVEVDTVAYYGDQTYPLMDSASLASDRIAAVKDQGYGTVVSTVTGTLSDKYIAEREALGFGKYISPDKQVDASTGLFPDTTWYLKNGEHHFAAYGGVFDRMVCDICRQKNITVDTDPRYPQFINFIEDQAVIVPAKEKNDNDKNWAQYEEDASKGVETFTGKMKALLQKVIDFFKGLIQGIIRFGKSFGGK